MASPALRTDPVPGARPRVPSRSVRRHLPGSVAVVGVVLAMAFPPPGALQAQASAAGAVEGTVEIHEPPPRRTASRYPGAAVAPSTVQSIPVLVWVEGSVAGSSTPASPLPVTLAQVDTVFEPAGAVVPVGTTVRFPNRDPFFHNVFSYSSAARFDLGRYPQGESKAVTLDRPGIVKIYCEVHETMRAVVVVSENPHHAVVGSDGRFRLEGLPAGRHTVVVWHADLGSRREEVEVRAGTVSTLSIELR